MTGKSAIASKQKRAIPAVTYPDAPSSEIPHHAPEPMAAETLYVSRSPFDAAPIAAVAYGLHVTAEEIAERRETCLREAAHAIRNKHTPPSDRILIACIAELDILSRIVPLMIKPAEKSA